MEEEEIDLILASSLEEGDLISVLGNIEKVSHVTDSESDFVEVYTEETGPEDPALVLRWDDRVSVYGY